MEELANGLLALGVRKGDAFGILAQSTLHWALFDYALGLIGAVGAAIYANSSPRDCCYILEHSDAVGVLVEDEGQREKVAGLGLAHVISFSELDALRARGREFAAARPTALAEAEAAVDEEDCFTFIYTSGTTGPPKACTIRHRNYYEMATAVDDIPEFAIADDVMLLFLPLAHNFGRLMHLLGAHTGYTIAFCPDPMHVMEAMAAVRPTLLPSVPRLYEKVHTGVQAQFDEAQGLRRRMLDWSLGVGRQASELREAGPAATGEPGGQAPHRRPARLPKVKDRLGGRLRVGISGRRTAGSRDRRVLPRPRHPDPRGLGTDRVHHGRLGQPPGRFRFGTVGPALPGLRGADRRGRRDPHPRRDRVRRLLQGRGGDARGARRRRLAAHRRHRRRSTRTASCASPIARRTSSSRPAARTSRRRTSRTRSRSSPLVSQALVVGDRRPYIAALITRRSGRGARDVPPEAPSASRRRRRRQRSALAVRADQALRRPSAGLHRRGGRGHADAQAEAARLRGALRARDRRAVPAS